MSISPGTSRKASPSNDARLMEVGVDLVEIARVKALARRNPKFLTRVFTAAEIAY